MGVLGGHGQLVAWSGGMGVKPPLGAEWLLGHMGVLFWGISVFMCWYVYINVGLFERKYTFCCAAASAEKECGREDASDKRN